MKKTAVFSLLFLLPLFAAAQIEMYITDRDVTTNIRSTPGGSIVRSVPNKGYVYLFRITEVRGKWLKIDKPSFVRYSEDGENEIRGLLDDVRGECWIHNTVAKTHICRPGAVPVEYRLHRTPSSTSKVIYVGNRQRGETWNDDDLILLEIRGKWKKVRNPEGITGWTDAELAVGLWSA